MSDTSETDSGRARVGLPAGNPSRSEPYAVEWHHIAKILREEAWQGRWNPLDESNVAPLAGTTAMALLNGVERLGLRLVLVDNDGKVPTDG